jgi:hypothetical protein
VVALGTWVAGLGWGEQPGVEKNALRGILVSVSRNGKEVTVKSRFEWVPRKRGYVFLKDSEELTFVFWDDQGKKLDADQTVGFFLPNDFIGGDKPLEFKSVIVPPPKAAKVAVRLEGPEVMTGKMAIPKER